MRVAIAGFGVAGGALAVLLARAGHEVTLFERAPQPGPVGGGLLLQPPGQAVLSELGLLEKVEARSARLSGIEAYTMEGKVFSDLKVARSQPGKYALGVHRGVLFEALHGAVREAGVNVSSGVEITNVREVAGAVVPLDKEGQERGAFDLLAACDGARSQLRLTVNPRMKRPRPSVWGALWGTGICQGVTDHLRQVADGTRRLAGIVPVGGGRATLFWGLHQDELEPLKARGFAAFEEAANALFPAAGEVLRDAGAFDKMTWATWHQIVPQHMVRGRIVLLGDAAHAMNPQLGQGANLALLDAASLVRQLDNLPAWERERRRAGRFYGRLSTWLSPFFQSRVPVLGTLRNLGLPLLTAIPWFRRQMELTLAGAKAGFFDRLSG